MSYEIHWSKKADKVLEKLPKATSHRIVNKVNLIKDNPFHFVEHYEGASYFKLRIGDYRVLLDIDVSLKLIEVRVVGHRGSIYKRV